MEKGGIWSKNKKIGRVFVHFMKFFQWAADARINVKFE